jgi:hypothetical protein
MAQEQFGTTTAVYNKLSYNTRTWQNRGQACDLAICVTLASE